MKANFILQSSSFWRHFQCSLVGTYWSLFGTISPPPDLHQALWLYVDDFLLTQRMDVLPLTAAFVAILLQIFAIPISWKKRIG